MRLASNESPWPPLPAVQEAIEQTLAALNRYPDPSSAALRRRLSERYGVPAERIAIGNGSCDILLAAGEALLEPGAELVYAWPSFSIYPHLGAASGARAVTVPLDARERHDLPAMLREITVATRLVVVCNPNNPTQHRAAARRDRRASWRRCPRTCASSIDEAYCEFNLLDDPDASVELLGEHPNLVLLRTFSKVYGLCGLRVGFALCGSPELPRALDQVRQPFFCNARGAGRRDRGAEPPGRRHRPRHPHDRRADLRWTSGCARWGWRPPTRRPTSAGSSSAKIETKPR